MGEKTRIEWTTATFNPWWGCAHVSPGCVHCYAETFAHRYGHEVWGAKGSRRTFGAQHWREPLVWNRKAHAEGRRWRVFCASMADVFENHPVLDGERSKLWELIEATPWLDWQLLTKRPENVARMAPWGDPWPANVWLGTSAEDQEWATARLARLVEIPARVRFASCEPLIGEVDLADWLGEHGLHWVIVGGESGAGARPMELAWAQQLVDQCVEACVPAFVKQLGSSWARRNGADARGGDWDRWPGSLRVRELPASVSEA